MLLSYLPAIGVLLLILLAIPVYAPRLAFVVGVGIVALAVFFFAKPTVPTEVKFNWGLDVPIGIALLLYAALWFGTALVSVRAARSGKRSTVIDERGLDQVRRAPAM